MAAERKQMRYWLILLVIVGFGSFALAQEKVAKSENEDERRCPAGCPFGHYPLFSYDSRQLNQILTKTKEILKSSPDKKVVFFYYQNSKGKKIRFNVFKSKIQKFLVKSNQIESSRVFVLDSGGKRDDETVYGVFIVPKDEEIPIKNKL
jgi:hypothetical protein